MKAWLKENLGLFITLVITTFYLIGIICITDLSVYKGLELNAKGDFLAGVFSPLAFLWLVFGYFQQGKELKLNTQALTMQAEELAISNTSLREQVKEMEKSVKAQQDMFDLAEKQYKDIQAEKDKASRPKLLVTAFNLTTSGDDRHGFDYRFQVKIKNLNVPIQNIKITSTFWSINIGSSGTVTESKVIRHIGLEKNDELSIRLHVFKSNDRLFNGETFKIDFEDHNNIPYKQECKIFKDSDGIVKIH